MKTENKIIISKYFNHQLILVFILLLAFSLRFFRLGEYPALNADEAALGYNAYSLLETGLDEHGNPWPIHFQSFNDYKPGLLVYLIIPFVKLFGLNIFWIRFLPALFGVLTVGLMYLLIRELFSNKFSLVNGQWLKKDKKEKLTINNQQSAITASFLLAISPWHIHFSRGAWEVNVATFLIVLGVLFFLKAINDKNRKSFAIWVLSFVLSLYTYHSARVIVPLLGSGLLIIYFSSIKKNIKSILLSGVFAIVLLFPLLIEMFSPAGLSRAAGVSIFADEGVINRINERRGSYEDPSGFLAVALHNKPIYYSWEFIKNWTAHFSPKFLFIEGDEIQRNKVPNTGQMYLFEALFLIAGVFYFIKLKTINRKSKLLVLLWLLVAPTAAALTFQSPHALRSQNMVIPLVILSSFGLYFVVITAKKFISNKILVVACYLLLATVVVWNFARYQHMYWVHMAKEYPFSSQYGVEQLENFVNENKDKDQRIVITDRYDQPYILFLFYLIYPPEQFQKEHNLTERDQFGFSTVSEFGDYHFRSIDYEEVRVEYPNAIIAGTDEEIPRETNIIKEIYGTNGFKYFEVVEN